jgi:hypothetical protein
MAHQTLAPQLPVGSSSGLCVDWPDAPETTEPFQDVV